MSSVQGVVFATAMAAVSGTAVILLALKLQKSISPPTPDAQFEADSPPASPPRPCLSSGERKGEKKKKRVRFAKDVVEPSANNEEFRKRLNSQIQSKTAAAAAAGTFTTTAVKMVRGGMPANRAALYNGILRDRVIHRMGYSY